MRSIKVGNAVFRVMYAGVSPFVDQFKTQIFFENFNIAQIANELDGNHGIIYEDGETTVEFIGYTRLIKIGYVDAETVVAVLERFDTVNGKGE